MTVAEGPALLSRLSNAQAVLRPTPRAAACLAVVVHPADANASRIRTSFRVCLSLRQSYFKEKEPQPNAALSFLTNDVTTATLVSRRP
jgi:hypothetical protein